MDEWILPPKDSLETQLRDEIDALRAINAEMLEALMAVKNAWEDAYQVSKVFRKGEVYCDPIELIKGDPIYQQVIAAIAKSEGNEAPSV